MPLEILPGQDETTVSIDLYPKLLWENQTLPKIFGWIWFFILIPGSKFGKEFLLKPPRIFLFWSYSDCPKTISRFKESLLNEAEIKIKVEDIKVYAETKM